MLISRMDLADTGSPSGLVRKILAVEKDLGFPVPIVELAHQLDILEIKALETEGFEGGLITDEDRSVGAILVKGGAREERRRFTIAHELGHFLMVTHRPRNSGRFLCSRADMRRWSADEQDIYNRMEVQANEFAGLILMPPTMLRSVLARFKDPHLEQVMAVAKAFEVSKEAAARTYAMYHDERVAIVVVHNGVIDRIYRNTTRFPRLSVRPGQPVPRHSVFHQAPDRRTISALEQGDAGAWLETEWGKPLPELYDQVMFQQEGYALILLWVEEAETDEEADPDEDRTSKQRLQDRQARWC